MKKLSVFFAGIFAAGAAFGAEGDVGTQAYQWSNYKPLDSVATPNGVSLSSFMGKVVLQVVFQSDCGGCNGNAPAIGKFIDSLQKLNLPIQGVGTEIKGRTFTQITQYNNSLRGTGTARLNTLNFPLVQVPFDTAITGKGVTGDPVSNIGTRWKRYMSYRDTYFIIDHTGKIVFRIQGDFIRSLPDTITKVKVAVLAALTNVPTPILCLNSCGKNGLKASRQGGGFRFNLNAPNGAVVVQILDLQGRMMRSFSIQPSSSEAVWNGRDAYGNAIPYGSYFLRATGSGVTSSQRISWQP